MNVSIIIPNYNKEKFLKETLKSISVNSSYLDIVIVDDHSTDNSWSLICELSEKYSLIRKDSNPGKGAPSARNHGLSMATGDYVIFLDSDDLLARGCIENRMKKIEADPDRDAWIFPMGCFEQKPGDLSANLNWIPSEKNLIKRFLSHQLPWAVCQPIWRKEFLDKIGGFDERFPRLQDVELHTKALLNGARVKCYPYQSPDCYYRISQERLSFSLNDFQKRFIAGARMYYSEFYPLVPAAKKKYLAGTLLETLSVLVHQYRIGNIGLIDYKESLNLLLGVCKSPRQKKLLRFYSAIQSTSRLHIKGLKKLTRTLLFT